MKILEVLKQGVRNILVRPVVEEDKMTAWISERCGLISPHIVQMVLDAELEYLEMEGIAVTKDS